MNINFDNTKDISIYPIKLKDIKIIFLTARGREMDIAKGLVLGADAYITKPFSNSAIVQRVKELLKCSED